MAKYIELIDKYRIEQGSGDYNPPSYIWEDNTGEIVRCGECKYWNGETNGCTRNPSVEAWYESDYCSYGEVKRWINTSVQTAL